ncbi:MAG: hypothetical protein GJ680_06860 [Alteromonadaceae bacterium]|nr:hypothetical protein [Alteromonadaceae bacterium]
MEEHQFSVEENRRFLELQKLENDARVRLANEYIAKFQETQEEVYYKYFFKLYWTPFFQLVSMIGMRQGLSAPDCDDLASELYIALRGKLRTYHHQGKFIPWLATVIRTSAINVKAKQVSRREDFIDQDVDFEAYNRLKSEHGSLEDKIASDTSGHNVGQKLAEFVKAELKPESTRRLFMECYVEGLSTLSEAINALRSGEARYADVPVEERELSADSHYQRISRFKKRLVEQFFAIKSGEVSLSDFKKHRKEEHS